MQETSNADLLVASTVVDQTILHRSVCLLVHEDEENVIGVLLNRPMQHATLQQLPKTPTEGKHRLEQHFGPVKDEPLKDEPVDDESETLSTNQISIISQSGDEQAIALLSQHLLHFGGPLSGPIVALHGEEQYAEAQAGSGLFMAAQRENLEGVLQSENSNFKLIVGHLGWTQEQLRNEIEAGVWHRIPAHADILATADESMWGQLIRRATTNSVARWLDIPDFPDSSLVN